MDYCDSMEKGVITMYNQIISNINSEYDMLLEESDIDSILKGQTQYYDANVVRMVENSVQDFVTDLLNSIREPRHRYQIHLRDFYWRWRSASEEIY